MRLTAKALGLRGKVLGLIGWNAALMDVDGHPFLKGLDVRDEGRVCYRGSAHALASHSLLRSGSLIASTISRFCASLMPAEYSPARRSAYWQSVQSDAPQGSCQTNRLKHQKPEERGFYDAIRERHSVKTASWFPLVFFSPPKAPTIDRILEKAKISGAERWRFPSLVFCRSLSKNIFDKFHEQFGDSKIPILPEGK